MMFDATATQALGVQSKALNRTANLFIDIGCVYGVVFLSTYIFSETTMLTMPFGAQITTNN